jgi:FKBP-type peptidyl-prolyl cis-trans isomerase FklB
MKIAAVTLSVILLASAVYAKDKIVLKNEKEKVSYSIGLDIGRNFKSQSIDIDPDILVKGVKDAISESKPLMTEEEVRDTMTNFRNEMKTKHEERMREAAEKNKKEGEAFLTENSKKEGIVTLPNGLQYKIISEGKGDNPKPTDMVTVNYRGTLIDGTEFDSSAKHGHGEPATFKVSGVIPGWTEALQLMKPGSKWQLFIPSKLAYGERGAGGNIGPNATLIFEVELISIQ